MPTFSLLLFCVFWLWSKLSLRSFSEKLWSSSSIDLWMLNSLTAALFLLYSLVGFLHKLWSNNCNSSCHKRVTFSWHFSSGHWSPGLSPPSSVLLSYSVHHHLWSVWSRFSPAWNSSERNQLSAGSSAELDKDTFTCFSQLSWSNCPGGFLICLGLPV